MSQNAAAPSPPSRPASSASSTSSLARVHDHSRPLPPPREPAALALASSPSFRSASRSPTTALLAGPRSATATQTTTTTTTSGVAGAGGEVSLQAPRPDGDRVANEYVETPFRPPPGQEHQHHHHHHHHHHQQQHHHKQQHKACPASKGKHQQQSAPGRPQRLLQRGPTASRGEPEATRLQQRPITKQPVSFTKEPANGPSQQQQQQQQQQPSSLSIVCERCGKCRCESCREPAPLPSRWLCNDACFCSAETALDYASCLCCVKGLFYHCADGGLAGSAAAASSTSLDSAELGPSCADEPCSCGGPRRAARWTCLGALALLLPCLLCYWPLRGCVAVAESCYAKHASHGCRCEPHQLIPQQQQQQALSRDPEKRLLEPLEP